MSDESEYRLLDTQYVYDAEHFPDPGRAIAVGSSPALSLLLFARELTGKPRCSLHSAIVPSGGANDLRLPAKCIAFLRRIGYFDEGWLVSWHEHTVTGASMLAYAQTVLDEGLVEDLIEEADNAVWAVR